MNQYFTQAQVEAIESIVETALSKNISPTKSDFVPVRQWCTDNSISLSKMYKLRNLGKVRFYQFGKNVFLKVAEIESLMTAA